MSSSVFSPYPPFRCRSPSHHLLFPTTNRTSFGHQLLLRSSLYRLRIICSSSNNDDVNYSNRKSPSEPAAIQLYNDIERYMYKPLLLLFTHQNLPSPLLFQVTEPPHPLIIVVSWIPSRTCLFFYYLITTSCFSSIAFWFYMIFYCLIVVAPLIQDSNLTAPG